MRQFIAAAALAALSSSAFAAGGTAVGIGSATSNSSARATGAAVVNTGNMSNTQRVNASGGAGGAGGTASATVNYYDPPAPNSGNAGGINGSSNSGNRWSNSSVNYPKQAPGVAPPALAPAGLESCMSSMSLGGSAASGALALGIPIRDGGCNARLNARTLYNLGFKSAAQQALCLDGDLSQALVAGGYQCAVGPNAQQPQAVAYAPAAVAPAAVPAQRVATAAPAGACLGKWNIFSGCQPGK